MLKLLLLIMLLICVGATGYLVWRWWELEWMPSGRRELWADRFASARAYLFATEPLSARKLQRYVARRAISQSVVTMGGTARVPDTVEVSIHPGDLSALPDDIVARLEDELAVWLRRQAHRKGWHITSRPIVIFRPDETAPTGRPRVRATFQEETVVAPGGPSEGGTVEEVGRTAAAIARLVEVASGDDYPLGDGDQRVLVGRSSSCDVRLEHPNVSRQHAAFWIENSDWVVEPSVHATNGLYVNGKRTDVRLTLGHGDEIGFGRALLYRFEIDAER